ATTQKPGNQSERISQFHYLFPNAFYQSPGSSPAAGVQDRPQSHLNAFGLQIDITYTYNLSAIIPQVIKGRQLLSNAAIDSPERRRLPLLLRRAWYGLNRAFRRRVAHLGLTPDQFTVMRTLLEKQGMTQRELVAAMSSDANTVAALIERMEAMG